MRDTSSVLPSVGVTRQEPFGRVVPLLKAALLLGVGGSSLLAIVLMLTLVLSLPLTTWWLALVQAYDHLQLYGWGTLFVVGIVLHFLPRLRGVPLEVSWLIPWIARIQVAALLLRLLSQPLLVVTGGMFWRILLILSGIFECSALGTIILLFLLMIWCSTKQMMRLTQRSQKNSRLVSYLRALLYAVRPRRSIELGLGGAFASLALAALLNLGNVVQAAASNGLVLGQGENLNVILGLFGFLVPVALMLSVHSLPTYADREELPQQIFWPLSTLYFVGLALIFIGTSWASSFPWLSVMSGCGMLLLALVLLTFIAVFLHLMRLQRWFLRPHVQQTSSLQEKTSLYQGTVAGAYSIYGPFVLLIASSYVWTTLGSLLLLIDGVAFLLGTSPFVSLDAIRYSFASGFIALLFAGISARMLPGFSGHKIVGPAWVVALFWIGNVAAVLRVGPLLLLPALIAWGNMGLSIYTILFDLSGAAVLAFAVCLVINLWPTLQTTKRYM